MSKTYQHIYLSPHYDDAALSCGGTIHQQTQAGQAVLVITICATPPPANEPFSAFAQSLHENWGNPVNVVSMRQAEDSAALGILGADYQRLEFTDCIYRGQPRQEVWYYNSNDDLFGQIHPADLSLADQIGRAVTAQAQGSVGAVVHAPLAVGNHVDHQLTHAAAWELLQQGRQVVFYEDYPYVDPSTAFGRANLDEILAHFEPAKLNPQQQALSEANLQAKINSIQAYESQLGVLFGSKEEVNRRVRDYALRVGAGKLAERSWTLA